MAPDVVLRKLEVLKRLLRDLEPHKGASLDEVRAEHYRIERILELLGTSAADLLQHLLGEREIIALTYRDVFRKAGEAVLIDSDLAGRLENAAGLRNVLVHLYEAIDVEILRVSIDRALRDFSELVVALVPYAEPES